MKPLSSQIEKGVYLLSSVDEEPFATRYLTYLQKTNRRYDDAEVREFPATFFYNLHRQEWACRAKASARLLAYLKRSEAPRRILDLGCGTGWLSHHMAHVSGCEVVGLDFCRPLVNQAARVFSHPSLQFAWGDIFEDIFAKGSFDLIILCDTITWFPNLPQLINRCRQFLRHEGEIHLIESPLYVEKDLETAREKTLRAYTELGLSDMSTLHFHHLRQDLSAYDFTYLYRPSWWHRLLGREDSPYPWVRITN